MSRLACGRSIRSCPVPSPAAIRWEWIDRNPAECAKLPKARPRTPASPTPEAVATVSAEARRQGFDQLALYLWLAAITGARRGELCRLQWVDIDPDVLPDWLTEIGLDPSTRRMASSPAPAANLDSREVG